MTEHIIKLLEEQPLASLSKTQREQIQSHTAACPDCLLAYEAARMASELLEERAAVVVTPPPFFETRVLAAAKARSIAPNSSPLTHFWATARPLLASIGASIATLLALTFFTDQPQPQTSPADLALRNDDASEWAIITPDADDELTNTQALELLYDPAVDAGDRDGK